jgi:Cu2+-exporting ATPase
MFAGMAPQIEQLLRYASGVLGVLSLLWPGQVFLRSARAALQTRTPHMDVPVALGLVAGTASSVVNTVRGVGDVYFDSISVLVFVLLLGRYIQAWQQRSAADAISLMRRLTPRWARVYRDQQWMEIPASLVRVGDHVEVRAGELIPADGRVTSGETAVDESILT